MDIDTLAELNPVKILAGFVGLGAMMAVGLLFARATGPSPQEMEKLRKERMQIQAAMETRAALDEMRYETNIDAADFQAALGQ